VRVFPVKTNAKTPLTEHGFKDATDDAKQIDEWIRQYPGCNWGAPTGISFVVLDLDANHPESFEWWREQQDIHGAVHTLEVSTPSGGTHIYFLAPQDIQLKSTASQIAPGVDTRANGGYVVIPPSAIDWNAYEVTNDAPIAEMPGWLLEVWPEAGQQRQREHSTEGRGFMSLWVTCSTPPSPAANGTHGWCRSLAGYGIVQM
jgi:Bifunctional DNA primase/polymerase, N-terminal